MSFSLLALVLVGATGLSSAFFDFYQKLLSRHMDPASMVFYLGLASIPLFLIGTWLAGWPRVEPAYWAPAFVSAALNLGGHVAFVRAVSISPLSAMVPLLSLTPVFTTLLASVMLAEMPNRTSLFGIALVVIGAFWLHAAPGDRESDWSRLLRDPGAWWMIGTAFAWSITIPLDKIAMASSSAFFHGLGLSVGITLGAGLLILPRGRPAARPSAAPARTFILALVFCTTTLAFQLLALGQTLVGIVETGKRGIANILSVLLGRFALDEAVALRELTASILMGGGVALILL